jgi:hypothetical protein
MKTKINTYLKLGILIFGFSFFLFSCEKDVSEIEQEQEIEQEIVIKSKYSISEIGFSEVKENTNLFEKLGQLTKKKIHNKNTLSKSVYSSEYDFTVTTDFGKYLESSDGEYHSYTFPVTRETDNGMLENLLVTLESDGSYEIFLISYNITDQEKLEFFEGKFIDFEDKINYTKINTDLLEQLFSRLAINCIDIYYTYCAEGNHAGGMSNGSACPAQSISSRPWCESSSGSSTSGDGTDGTGDGTTSGGGSDGNESENESDPNEVEEGPNDEDQNDEDPDNDPIQVTTPVVPPEEVIKVCLNEIMLSGTSNVDIAGWLDNANVLQKKAVANYLNSNSSNPVAGNDTNCDDPVALGFVELAIQVMLNGETTDFQEALDIIISTIIEDEIVDDNLDDCSKGILNELKTLQSTDIAEIIKRFGDLNAPYDWEIKTGTPPVNSNNSAETDWKRDLNGVAIDYDYLTFINPTYKNQATKIGVARVILHEMIHAYLISLVDDTTITGSSDVTNFPLLWNALVTNTYNNNPNQLQHEIIGRRFIEPLKDALKEWDNSSQSNQYYEDLAWGALTNTSTFNILFPIGSQSRNRIINTNAAEDTNSPQGSISPKGNPCP